MTVFDNTEDIIEPSTFKASLVDGKESIVRCKQFSLIKSTP